MAVEKKLAGVKRFGPRYGRSLKQKFIKVESEHRKTHKCPYCSGIKATRVSVGIWSCARCGAKFTGRAYTIPKKLIIKESALKEAAETIEEADEGASEEIAEEEKPQRYKEKMQETAEEQQPEEAAEQEEEQAEEKEEEEQ